MREQQVSTGHRVRNRKLSAKRKENIPKFANIKAPVSATVYKVLCLAIILDNDDEKIVIEV